MKTATKRNLILFGIVVCILLVSCGNKSPLETIVDEERITEQATVLPDDTMPAEQTMTEATTALEESTDFAEAKMLFQCDVTAMRDLIIPDVSLTAEPLALIPLDSDYKWIGDEYAASVSIREVGHTPVTISAEEARIYVSHWIQEHCRDYPENMIFTEDMEVNPITMGSGNAEDQIVAYSVLKTNCYNGIPVIGDHYNMIVDDGGAVYISLQWSECKETAICTSGSGSAPVNFDTAAQLVRQHLSQPGGYQIPNSEDLRDIQVNDVELVYCFNENNGMYQPNWRFSVDGYCFVLVNCMDGQITEM